MLHGGGKYRSIELFSRLALNHWPEASPMILALWLASRPDTFGQNLTQSAEPNWIWAGFALYDPGCMWKNAVESKSKSRPGHPDQIWASFVQYDPGLLWKNRSKLDAGSWIWHIIINNLLYI